MGKAKSAVQSNAKGMQTAMEKVKNSFTSSIGGITKLQGALAGLGMFLSARVLVRGFMEIATMMDRMEESSQKTGVGVESLQVFGMAAKLASVDNEALIKGLVKLQRNMFDYTSGLQDAKVGFDNLGISVKDETGNLKLTDQIFMEIADKFEAMPDGAQKAALAMKMFGKAGAELIPMLNMGSEGINKLREDMGYLFTQEDAIRAAVFTDNIDLIGRVLKGMQMQIVAGSLPALLQLSESFKVAAKDGGDFRETGSALGNMLLWVAKTGYFVSASMRTVGVSIAAFIAKVKARSREEVTAADALEAGILTDIWAGYEAKIAALNKPVTIPSPRKRGGGAGDETAKNAAADALLKRQEAILLQLQREADLINVITRAEKMKWEIEQGAYKDFDAASKEKLIALATEIDTLEAAKKLTEEVKKNREEIEKQIKTIIEQAEAFGKSEREITLNKLAMQGATAQELELADAFLRAKERLEEIKKITEDIKTPQEAYNEQIAKLKTLLEDSAITWDQYTAAAQKAKEAMDAATKKGKDSFDELRKAIEGWGKDSAKAIADFALKGEGSFSDMADSIISDILRMMIYQQITGPLFSGISTGLFGTKEGEGGLLSGLFGGGKQGGGSVSSGKMYEVNETGIPELLNVGNRQFLMMGNNSGYVAAANAASAGGSGPGGGGVVVNIIDNNNNQITQNSKTDGNGRMQLDVILDAAIAKKMSTFGSKSNKAIRQNFNIKEKMVSR